MTEATEPAGDATLAAPSGTGDDFALRVDRMFEGAIEQQLSEQRTLNDLLARVEAGLAALRADLAELTRRALRRAAERVTTSPGV